MSEPGGVMDCDLVGDGVVVRIAGIAGILGRYDIVDKECGII